MTSDPHSDVASGSDAASDADADSESHADSRSDADAGSDSRSDSDSGSDSDSDSGSGRLVPEETEHERITRNWNELLQELRVSQTGVQILFAFLRGVAFTRPFEQATSVQRGLYFTALIATAFAVGLLIAPVAYHRILFRQRSRRELVTLANRFAIGGLVFTAIAVVAAVGLVADFTLHAPWGVLIPAVTAAWFLFWWLASPLRRRARQDDSEDP
jgi:hypothetical protein